MFSSIITPIVALLNSIVAPLLGLVGALGTVYCVILGIKYAKAEEPQEREKAKGSLKNAVLGFFMIFILILGLNVLMPELINWVNTEATTTVITTTTIDTDDDDDDD